MEGVVVSAATGALKPVLGKLAALVSDEYMRFKGVSSDIKFLIDELAAMHAFLLKMSEQEDPDVQDKAWMTEVRELSYDIEDCLDEFMLSVDDKPVKQRDFIQRCKNLLAKMKTRRRIAKAIEDFKAQVKEVGERHARYRTGETIIKTSNGTIDRRALAIFENASNLVGIDESKAELVKLMAKESGCASAQLQLKVVSVVGFGGIGKTTLAKQVYQELRGNYECGAFISVSRNPDVTKILRIILSEVSGMHYANTKDADEKQLIARISNFLADKRYLIVVDDIWNVDIWDIIKCAFSMNSCGSRVITTSRINDVARSSCASFNGQVYNIRPLNMVHSRQLFHKRLFNSEEKCPSHLEEVSTEILKRCDGLPLAIIAISGLLAKKERTKDQWDRVKNSIGYGLERNPSVDRMISILSLSYFDLPPHLKTCLLYLSIFPEDHIIKKNDLILRWIAEGFIHKEGSYTLYESGEMCFSELVNRNLIQLLPEKINFVKFEELDYNNCQVHDTILDFLISMSSKDNFVTIVGSSDLTVGNKNKVRRLSCQVGVQGNSLVSKMLTLSHARSVDVFRHPQELPSLVEFRHLRVVSFQGCRWLQKHHLANIGKLFQLRYLNLKNTGVNELPEEIGCLQYLETLNVKGSNMDQLPPYITRLGNLMHLLIGRSARLPDGIAKMQSLETLKEVYLLKHSSNIVKELGQLKNLRELMLYTENYGMARDACMQHMMNLASSLFQLGAHNLRRIYIHTSFTTFHNCFLPDPWCPAPLKLEELVIHDSPMARIPTWMGSLVHLKMLRLVVTGVVHEDLCLLGCLPSLLHLSLLVREEEAVCKDRLVISGYYGFPCLRLFYLTGQELTFSAGSMPKLEQLWFWFDIAKTGFLTNGGFDIRIENLPCLTTIWCRIYHNGNYSPVEVEVAKAALQRAVNSHPNHPSLQFF